MTDGQPEKFRRGDFYEGCSFHPVLCTYVNEYMIGGISLIDGSTPRECFFVRYDVIKTDSGRCDRHEGRLVCARGEAAGRG